MKQRMMIDTGPLVAFLCQADARHQWVTTQLDDVNPPLLTCEAVISETCFLLQRHHADASAVLALLRQQLLTVPFRISEESESIFQLMSKYADVPMDLADGSLLVVAEMMGIQHIVTIDSDYAIYRTKNKQWLINLLDIDATFRKTR